MRIGIMGGTFDPIHIGHLIAAERARDEMKLDEVWFMPAHVPPHKEVQPEATPEDRLAMVRLATQNCGSFRVTDIELTREGLSYSIDTVTDLSQRYPDHRFSFIIGADMVEYLPHWHRIEQLARMITFIGLNRPGYSVETDLLPDAIRQSVKIVSMPLISISSTSIRSQRKNGGSIRFLVPEPVYEYIERNRLYES